MLLLVSVVFLGAWLNMIPLACLAAILLVTGIKLASPALVKQMWSQGRYQFAPFVVTVVAIVLTDLLIGVVIGLALSIAFILSSNIRRPIRRVIEKHLGGEVVHIVLASQVSFFNRAALIRVLDEVPAGGHILIDAQNTDYVDPDVLHLIRDFKEETGPARGVEVSLLGFRSQYHLEDQTQYVDYSTSEIQRSLTPGQVLDLLKEGHERFRSGRRLTRDLGRQVNATANGQHPLAVVLSCVDSRSPAELIFDLGVGDIFSVRIAGNITSRKVLGSLEYCCAVAGAKLILVMGHTRCGAVTAAVEHVCSDRSADCEESEYIGHVLHDILDSFDAHTCGNIDAMTPEDRRAFIDEVARRNVDRVTQAITDESRTLAALVSEGRIAIVGAMYDISTGGIEFLPNLGRKDAHDFSPV
jgi:carbonic anhydrase/SulP family sulfate permease